MKKFYVAKKDPKTNTIIAAPEGHKILLRKEIKIKNPYWINKEPKDKERAHARIRQVGELIPCTILYKNKKFEAILDKAITGVSQGQAIVLYKKTRCLGGGIIDF